MKKAFLFLPLLVFGMAVFIGCGDEDVIGQKMVEFKFSQNDIVLDNGKQSFEVNVTNYKKTRKWYIHEIKISDGKAYSYYYDNEKYHMEDSEGNDLGCPDDVADYCYRLIKKNDGESLQVVLDENNTGVDRNIEISIWNGYDQGKLKITQRK